MQFKHLLQDGFEEQDWRFGVITRLDSISAIKDVRGGDALFILRDGLERRMSLLTDFRVLYLTNNKGASEKVDLARVKNVEFLAP